MSHPASDVAPGAAFCYENANGLAEIAVNGGSAAERLGLAADVRLRYEAAPA
jgi:S-adenosylmethionine hydrolase